MMNVMQFVKIFLSEIDKNWLLRAPTKEEEDPKTCLTRSLMSSYGSIATQIWSDPFLKTW